VELNPKDADSHYQIARLLVEEGNKEEAQTVLGKVLLAKSDHAPSRHLLGDILLEKGKTDEAYIELKQALSLESENPVYMQSMAAVLVVKNELDQALKKLLAASKMASENHEIFFDICTVYSKKGWYTAAIGHCEKALELNASHYDTMNRLAWLYAKKKTNLAKGLQLSKKTLKANPDRDDYLDTLSEVYFAKGKYDFAIKIIKSAIKLRPDESYYRQQLWKFKNAKSKTLASAK
jgi:tetratricopeptide (TPR) repeat protein